jgi:LysM repeat protein
MMTTSTPARVAVLLITVVVALVLLLANTVAASDPSQSTGSEAVLEVSTHRVISGDTLWGIASTHTPAGDDVRKTVFRIQDHNGLANSVIVPGQVLEIPLSD